MNPPLVPAPSVVMATSTADVVGIIPIVLGFRPSDSVVVLGLLGHRRAIGPMLRYDVDIPPDDAAAQMLPTLVQHGVVAVFVAVYTDDVPYTAAVAAAFIDTCQLADVEVYDVVRVHDGHWRSVLVSDPADEPVPDPATAPAAGATGAVAAMAVAEGRVILPSRAELVALMAGPSPAELPAATARLDAAHARMAALSAADGPDAVHARVMSLLAEEVAHRAGIDRSCTDEPDSPSGSSSWSADDAAFVTAATSHLSIRDDLATTPDLPLDALLDVLCAAARAAPDIDAVELCCAIAWLALRLGNGALANVALDRALNTHPDAGLAVTLLQMSAMMPAPDEVEHWTTSARAYLTGGTS